MGRNGNGNTCIECQSRLTPIKLYAPEILRVFSGGNKEYTRLGILSNYSVCLNRGCDHGLKNITSYERIVEEGMIRQE
jgi:hypothetical protein